MDYREVENRLARNRDMLKEREHDRLVKVALNTYEPHRTSRFVALWFWVLSLRVRKPSSQPDVCLQTRQQVD